MTAGGVRAEFAVVLAGVMDGCNADVFRLIGIAAIAQQVFTIRTPAPVDAAFTKACIDDHVDVLKVAVCGHDIGDAWFATFFDDAVIAEVKKHSRALAVPSDTVEHQR